MEMGSGKWNRMNANRQGQARKGKKNILFFTLLVCQLRKAHTHRPTPLWIISEREGGVGSSGLGKGEQRISILTGKVVGGGAAKWRGQKWNGVEDPNLWTMKEK